MKWYRFGCLFITCSTEIPPICPTFYQYFGLLPCFATLFCVPVVFYGHFGGFAQYFLWNRRNSPKSQYLCAVWEIKRPQFVRRMPPICPGNAPNLSMNNICMHHFYQNLAHFSRISVFHDKTPPICPGNPPLICPWNNIVSDACITGSTETPPICPTFYQYFGALPCFTTLFCISTFFTDILGVLHNAFCKIDAMVRKASIHALSERSYTPNLSEENPQFVREMPLICPWNSICMHHFYQNLSYLPLIVAYNYLNAPNLSGKYP